MEALAQAHIGETFNFYRRGPGAALRRARLADYLELHMDAPLLLVAEAPGFRGTRISGIPLTSERQLSGTGPAEATATIVHRVLAELGLVQSVLLWNVVPTHPHLPGKPASNRRPTRDRGGGVPPLPRRTCAWPQRPPGRKARRVGTRDARHQAPFARWRGRLPGGADEIRP